MTEELLASSRDGRTFMQSFVYASNKLLFFDVMKQRFNDKDWYLTQFLPVAGPQKVVISAEEALRRGNVVVLRRALACLEQMAPRDVVAGLNAVGKAGLLGQLVSHHDVEVAETSKRLNSVCENIGKSKKMSMREQILMDMQRKKEEEGVDAKRLKSNDGNAIKGGSRKRVSWKAPLVEVRTFRKNEPVDRDSARKMLVDENEEVAEENVPVKRTVSDLFRNEKEQERRMLRHAREERMKRERAIREMRARCPWREPRCVSRGILYDADRIVEIREQTPTSEHVKEFGRRKNASPALFVNRSAVPDSPYSPPPRDFRNEFLDNEEKEVDVHTLLKRLRPNTTQQQVQQAPNPKGLYPLLSALTGAVQPQYQYPSFPQQQQPMFSYPLYKPQQFAVPQQQQFYPGTQNSSQFSAPPQQTNNFSAAIPNLEEEVSREMHTRYKRVKCKFYDMGKCSKGDRCRFIHGLDDPYRPDGPKFDSDHVRNVIREALLMEEQRTERSRRVR